MVMKYILSASLTVLMMLSSLASADWTGRGEAGFVNSNGNTDSQSLNLGLKFEYKEEAWRHALGASAFRASNNGVDSAENVSAFYELNYALSPRSFVFAGLNYLDDKFDGFTDQISGSLGYGYKVFDTEMSKWQLGAGLGYRDTHQLLRLPDGSEVEGRDLSNATIVLKSDLRTQLTTSTEFVDKFMAEIGSDNTFIENDASLVVAINERFALKAGIVVRHNTDPAPGADETDTITSANLVYKF